MFIFVIIPVLLLALNFLILYVIKKQGQRTQSKQTYTENWKDLFQPQSVNSALLAKVWFSPSWSHLSATWAKKAASKGYSSPGTKSALANWTVLALI